MSVEIVVALRPRAGDEWVIGAAGWYVVCNGRVVVVADQTDLTGWGVAGPQFASKYRGFVGVAFFFSDKPSTLPWTTTKRGLNRESKVFQLARNEMAAAARPVLSFLNDMYPSDAPSEVVERDLADGVRSTALHELAAGGTGAFKVTGVSKRGRVPTVSVQFRARRSDVERAKKCLAKPGWGAGKVGAYALKYLLDQECPDD